MATLTKESPNEKEYSIPITWESYMEIKVSAPNLEEAITKALKEFLSIPDENYLEDSFDVDLQNLEEEYPNEDFNMDIVYSKL
jgi:hypothetical protein